MKSSQGINLNANAGVQMPMTSKAEFFKYIDCVNAANQDQLTASAVKKQQQLRCLTAKVLSGRVISDAVKCDDLTTIITAGGSEANCLAIKAVTKFNQCNQQRTRDQQDQVRRCKLHIVSSAYEHKSVLKCLEQMQLEEVVDVSFAYPDYKGVIQAGDVTKLIRDNTVLVSIMSANNELGSDNREQLKLIGNQLRNINRERAQKGLQRIYFHSDCVQTFAKYEGFMDQANLDMASCSYYKVYGANRIGALVIRGEMMSIIKDHPLVNSTLLDVEGTHGGTQSLASTAASLNSLQICLRNRENKHKRIQSLRKYLGDQIQEQFSQALGDVVFMHYRPDTEKNVKKSNGQWHLIVFSHPDASLPNTFMFSLVRNYKNKLDAPCGKKLVDHASQNGIIIATGSACGSQLSADQKGYVLQAIGVSEKLQQAAIRVSFSDFTIKHHIRLLVNCLASYMRDIYPLL